MGAPATLGHGLTEVRLAGEAGTVPIQLMWSNDDDGPVSAT
jgi:hypothetical protein